MPRRHRDEKSTLPPDLVNVFGSLRIDAVTVSQASGEITFYESDCKRPQNVPDRQWTFTTGAYGQTGPECSEKGSRFIIIGS